MREGGGVEGIHTDGFDVPEEAIDGLGHVNNREYLGWMQEVATAHSAARGWPEERYLESGATWVVRSHFVEYLRPAVLGDRLVVHTWVHTMEGSSSARRYLFLRERDGARIARAETLWVFVQLPDGRPRRIPADLRAAFPLVEDRQVATVAGEGYGPPAGVGTPGGSR